MGPFGKAPEAAPQADDVLLPTGIPSVTLCPMGFRSEESRRRFNFGFLCFFVELKYTFGAVFKLIGTGITWPDGRHLLV